MPKMKTVKAAVKRFTKTGSGRVKRGKAYATHLLKNKSTKNKRGYRQDALVSKADEKNILKMI